MRRVAVALAVSLSLLATAGASADAPPVNLLPMVQYPSGGGGSLVFTGDFNGDGRLDVGAVSSVLLGRGDGTFDPGPGLGATLAAPVVADLNGDGRLDLAYVEGGIYSAPPGPAPADVVVLLGNGDGTFQPPVRTMPSRPNAAGLAAGDFDRDGRIDLVLKTAGFIGSPSHFDGELDFLRGDGSGHFAPPVSTPVAGGADTPVVADFDGDGKLDVVVMSGQSEVLLPGHGDGGFGPAREVCDGCHAGLAADFNGDGKPDLETGSATLLANGDGTFRTLPRAKKDLGVPLAAGDVNADGRLDLIADDETQVAVSPGLGNGTFGKPADYRAVQGGEGDTVTTLATGDFNGDGRTDVVVGPDGEGVIDVMLAAPFKRGACSNPKLTPPAIGGVSFTEGTPYGDSIHGGYGKDTINGLGGDDCLYGGGVHWTIVGAQPLTPPPLGSLRDNSDTLRGGPGNDRLYGMTGNDRLYGGPGNDLLVGGLGHNRYYGGPGNDRIRARNGLAETVHCGTGRDTVIADRSDRLIGCELAHRPG